jgi:hypothetical protein
MAVVFEEFKSPAYKKLAEECTAAIAAGNKPLVAELMAKKKAEHAKCWAAYQRAKKGVTEADPTHKALKREREESSKAAARAAAAAAPAGPQAPPQA